MTTNNINQLPQSDQLNISALASLFRHTTTSYKYLFFISLLDILHEKQFNLCDTISLREIIIEMLVNAWYPHKYFRLSFGIQDKIANLLDTLNLASKLLTYADKKELRRIINNNNLSQIEDYIKKNVPFRLLTPFIKEELRSYNVDYEVVMHIPRIAKEFFNTKNPLYCFNANTYKDSDSIILHPDWINYLKTNYGIVRGWVSWEWLQYIQKCNPNTPGISNKLFIPQTREPLTSQTNYWKLVLQKTEVKCIYSQIELTYDNISLDHYLPWSFVVHNQLWNLIPTTRSINSAKSNNIPSSIYFNQFVNLQHMGLITSHQHMTKSKWNHYIENYITDLRISQADLLNLSKLKQAYELTLNPLIALASSQGFIQDWTYQKIETGA